jgi:uncharacterized damage-inducible protein DinB/predicted RNase H-like HicB family nuclease
LTRYPVYLEIARDGLTMAHVHDLPGCAVRASTPDEALRRAPEAVREYCTWLRRHGEPLPSEEELIDVEVAGESTGFGPFDPGDAAALFPPDREPITPEEMECLFRLMAYARSNLLAMVRDLPDDVLDWQPDSQSFSVRRLLRHIGNAEEWYVSRLVPPETLPPEWERDEDLPIFGFLEMERRTAVARLRQLTQEERSGVFRPMHWTDHPEELWTARKALRRFLEHEREHTAQVRETLTIHRRHLLARLAAERSGLLEQLIGLDERALTEVLAVGDWTVKEVLAHIAAWDRWVLREMKRMLRGEAPDITTAQNEDAFNAANVPAWRNRALEEVLAELQEARATWVAWLETLPVEEFFRRRSFQGDNWAFPGWLKVYWRHDAEHAAQIATWREAQGLKGKSGLKAVLLAALQAGREELLAAAALVPAGERASRPVCGEWTLKDVLGHVADWEWLDVEGLRQMADGHAPQVELVGDREAWNQVHVKARRDQPWEAVWAGFQAAHQALVEVLRGMSQDNLSRPFPGVWEPETTPYAWALVILRHHRGHAKNLRNTGGIP